MFFGTKKEGDYFPLSSNYFFEMANCLYLL